MADSRHRPPALSLPFSSASRAVPEQVLPCPDLSHQLGDVEPVTSADVLAGGMTQSRLTRRIRC